MGAKTHEVVTHDTKGYYAWLVWCPACAAANTSVPAPDWASTRFGRMRSDGVVPAVGDP